MTEKSKLLTKNSRKKLKNFFLIFKYLILHPSSLIKAIPLIIFNPTMFKKKLSQVKKRIVQYKIYRLNLFYYYLSLSKSFLKSLSDNFYNKILFNKGKKYQLRPKNLNYHSDIFIFGVTAFHYRIQRLQHFAYELAKNNHRIFYIENEFNYSNHNNIPQNIYIKEEKRNLFIIKLCSSKNYFIYNQIPQEKDIKIMFASIKTIIRKFHVINPLAIIAHPFWGFLAKKLSMPVIYDLIDYHRGFKENSKKIIAIEEILLKNSDLVTVTSDFLYRLAEEQGFKNIVKIPNAGDFNFFYSIYKKKIEPPSDLKKIKQPIIGYYGAIDYWFDANLLKKIALNFPNASIVLIGRVTNTKVWNLANQYRNIFILGEKKYVYLPNYLKHFKVCLIPFINNQLIKATDPVKIYEYFSMGKPVVATNIDELKKFSVLIYLSKNSSDFIKNIKKALEEKNRVLINKRINIAKNNTWKKRVEILEENIKKIFFPKVSIIILSYNKGLLTQRCVKSILTKSYYPNFEIIIVDNHSTEKKTLDILEQLRNNDKINIIYNQKNFGFAQGNNIGMEEAKGKFIVLLNNDTVVTPGWLSRLVYHASEEDTGLIGPVTNNIGNESKISIDYKTLREMEDKALDYTSSHWGEKLELERIAAFCWIKRADVYKKIGELDKRFFPAFFEDDDYCLRIRNSGYKIYCAEDVFIHHELGSSTTKEKPKQYQIFFEQNKKKFEKKWGIKWQPPQYRPNII